MTLSANSKPLQWLFPAVIILAFIIFKLPYLNLPFYWDEAWVYGPAVQTMTENGPSLLPSGLPPELSRGHPLLFHFLASCWGSIFGTGHYSLHVFILLLSALTIAMIFRGVFKLFGLLPAILATITFTLQPMFLSQSGLVLPEVMLTLFSVSALFMYLEGKWGYFILAASAAILTKETGVVILGAVGLHYLLFSWKTLTSKPLEFIKIGSLIVLPILPWVLFLLIQRIQNGWIFFPDHVDLVSFDFGIVLQKFEHFSGLLFLYQGRKLFIIFLLVAILYHLIKKKAFPQSKEITLFFLFVLTFLVFSSVNYYSDRYLLPAVPMLIIFITGSIKEIINKPLFFAITVVSTIAVFIRMNFEVSNSDHNLGYANAIHCHMDVIQYCEKEKLHEKEFFIYFLGRVAMSDPANGYIKRPFKKTNAEFTQNTDFCIFANFDSDEDNLSYRNRDDITLIYRTEHKQAWAEVYRVNK